MDRELHERHVGDLGRAAGDLTAGERGAEGEQGAGACRAAEQVQEIGQGRGGIEARGGGGQAGEDGHDQGVPGEG